MLKREVVNTDNNRAWSKGRSSELNVQNIDRVLAQLGAECKRNANYRSVRTCLTDDEV